MKITASTIPGEQYAHIALDLIAPSLTNPRKKFDPAKLQELADSIKPSGVHQPVLLRPLPASRVQETSKPAKGAQRPTFELVSGERRLRASIMAGVPTIPARIRELTDTQVFEIQIVENLQREDLTELEEAEGYESLMRQVSLNADEVGAKIGKSRSYVYARLKLLDLCSDARTSLREGKIDASRGLLLARIPDQKLQIKALKEIVDGHYGYSSDRESMTLRQAATHIQQNYMLKLGDAKFTITDADLVPAAGSCKTCPKRTGHDPDLFSDVKGADVCTDPPCFHKKQDAHAAALVKAAKAKGQTVIAGKEAQELMTQGYQPKFKGYRRLDDAEDSPTDQPLRKIIGKQMQAEGITAVMIEHPKRKGELIAVLPNEVVSRLLKAVEGQANAAKTVAKEVREFASEKKAKADKKAKAQFEQDWRVQLIERAWKALNKGGLAAFSLDVHRYLALKAANSLSTEQTATLCQFLDLGKVARHGALTDFIEETTSPDLVQLLMIMVRDSDPTDHSYGGRTVNEGLHMVAGLVFKDTLPEVIKEVKAASLIKFFPNAKPPKPPTTGVSLAQPKSAAGEKNAPAAASAKTGKKPGRLSPEDAKAGIAEAMQGLKGKAASTALQPVSTALANLDAAMKAAGKNLATKAQGSAAVPQANGKPGKIQPTAPLVVTSRVKVKEEDALRPNVARFAGKLGEVIKVDGSDYQVKLDGRNGFNAGTRDFVTGEIEAVLL